MMMILMQLILISISVRCVLLCQISAYHVVLSTRGPHVIVNLGIYIFINIHAIFVIFPMKSFSVGTVSVDQIHTLYV